MASNDFILPQHTTFQETHPLHEKLQARKWYDGLLPAVIGVAAISAAFLYFNKQSQEHTKKLRNKKKEGQVQSYGKALIGGPFELVRGDNGETCNEQILKNKWTLLYFGFNFCPDVCPDEMEKMADANRLLSRARTENKEHYETEKIADHQCIYISIDPKRDTPKKADDYIELKYKINQVLVQPWFLVPFSLLVLFSPCETGIFHLMSRQNISW